MNERTMNENKFKTQKQLVTKYSLALQSAPPPLPRHTVILIIGKQGHCPGQRARFARISPWREVGPPVASKPKCRCMKLLFMGVTSAACCMEGLGWASAGRRGRVSHIDAFETTACTSQSSDLLYFWKYLSQKTRNFPDHRGLLPGDRAPCQLYASLCDWRTTFSVIALSYNVIILSSAIMYKTPKLYCACRLVCMQYSMQHSVIHW